MKTKTTILLLLLTAILKAQDKRFTLSTYTDPVATYKDGFNLGAAIEYQMHVTYFKAQTFVFPELRGNKYIETTGSIGVNQHHYFDEWRTYQGFKLGLIHREATHPTIGFELGIEKYFNGFYIGGGWSYDYRTDGKEQEPDIKNYWRLSGLIKIGVEL